MSNDPNITVDMFGVPNSVNMIDASTCVNATQIQEQVIKYCTGEIFMQILILSVVAMLFFILVFSTFVRTFNHMNREGIISFELGLAQLQIGLSQGDKMKMFQRFPEVGNLWTYFTTLVYGAIVLICMVSVLIILLMNYI